MSLLTEASLIVTPNAYKAGTLYSVIPNTTLGDMDVVRATTATRVNSAGLIESVAINVPRIDYPALGGCPSILVEPVRTNLLLRSEEFDNALWTKINTTIIVNSTNSPSGNLTADSIFETTANDNHGTYQTAVLANATAYTYSFFVKPNGRNWVSIRFLPVNGVFVSSNVWFDILNGIIGTTDSGITATIQASSNGFYKITATRTTSAAGVGFVGLYLAQNNNSQAYAGTSTSGIFIWGAQLEAGSNATSYIPTTINTVTRNADVISKTGISSLIGQTEGSIFIDFSLINTSYDQDFLRTNFLDFNNTIVFRKRSLSNNLEVFLRISGATILFFTFISLQTNSKVCFIYKSGSSSLFVNSVSVKNSTSISSFIISTQFNDLILGAFNDTGINHSNIKINSVQLYKTALTDDQCILLTGPSFSSYVEMANNFPNTLIYTLQ